MCDVQYIIVSTGENGIYNDPTDFTYYNAVIAPSYRESKCM